MGALAHAVLHGMIAPTPEEREERGRPLYVVDSDGDRFEFHEATIPLAPIVEQRLALIAEWWRGGTRRQQCDPVAERRA